MGRCFLVAGALAIAVAAVAGRARADSIDDAEAQKRGVPVEVVILERQLEQAKKKTADLEKQVAQVQKKIDALKVGKPGAEGAAALGKEDEQLPALVEGERKSSPIYDDAVSLYMSGDWKDLAGDINRSQALLSALPAANASDVAYIQAAMQECRPAWWEMVKGGKAQTIQMKLFNRELTVNYKAGEAAGVAGTSKGKIVVVASWPAGDMDSIDPAKGVSVGGLPEGNFTQGELVNTLIWTNVGMEIPEVDYGEVKLAQLSRSDENNMRAFKYLLGTAASVYYATPAVRRFALRECAESFSSKRRETAYLWAQRQLSAVLAIELMLHPERYPSLDLTFTGLPEQLPKNKTAEQYLMETFIAPALKEHKLTFAEDCAIRRAVWEFVMSLSDWTTDQIKLPNGQVMQGNVTKDEQAMHDRWAWYRQASAGKPAG